MSAETTKAAQTVKKLIATLVGTHEPRDPPDADQRTAAYWWGTPDEALRFSLGSADLMARDPIAGTLYLAKAAEDKTQFQRIKAWGYGVAAEYATGRTAGPRNRVRVEGYRAEWGRVAARDGLARALWPEMVDEMPGRDARCAVLKVGHDPFKRVRDEVENRAKRVIDEYRLDLENLLVDRVTPDMQHRLDNRAANWG